MTAYDVMVIGGGAGGLSAAHTVRREGASVALVSDGPIGGDCTFTGCVPSKTLIEAAARGESFATAMAAVHEAVESVAETETADVLRAEGIDVVEGRGRLDGRGTVVVGERRFATSAIVIATGARPGLPPVDGIDNTAVLTSDSFWSLTEAPLSLAVLGGGAIGCEIAQAVARLGVPVTLFEMDERLVPLEEPEASAIVEQALVGAGVDVVTGARVLKVSQCSGGVVVCTAGRTVTVERVLVATGRVPNTSDLGLETAGVELDEGGHVITDAKLASTAAKVWAVGDVTAKLAFTHAADEMGRLAGWNITRRLARYRFEPSWIPWVTFTDPEVARVGTTEADAPAGARVVELPMRANDRAITARRTEGFVKIVVAPRTVLRNTGGGKVVGATIAAPRAGEMIHEPALAMRTNMFAGRLAQMVHAYPTWSTAIQQAMAQLFVEIDGRRARPAERR